LARVSHNTSRHQISTIKALNLLARRLSNGTYRQRSHLAETAFARWSTTMSLKQLLLRGIGKVATEIGWTCTAGNLKKITRLLAAQRLRVAAG
jgi:hypothetical protein